MWGGLNEGVKGVRYYPCFISFSGFDSYYFLFIIKGKKEKPQINSNLFLFISCFFFLAKSKNRPTKPKQ